MLQRILERGRLAHGYLFTGSDLDHLEAVARALAQALNCQRPPSRNSSGRPVEACGRCSACVRIGGGSHPDVQWVRPESKSRVILIDQMRELMQTIHLKPTEAECKVAVIVAADRLNPQAANAFLKTLEEPPPRAIILLLTTQMERMMDTIISRCQRLTFGGETRPFDEPTRALVEEFSRSALSSSQDGILGRYQLLGVLLQRLNALKEAAEKESEARSPLARHDDVDPRSRDKWEDEQAAAAEAEYRRRRSELILSLQWWARDVWLQTRLPAGELLVFPDLAERSGAVARRLNPRQAEANLGAFDRLQSALSTNVQEALALEVCLLQLQL